MGKLRRQETLAEAGIVVKQQPSPLDVSMQVRNQTSALQSNSIYSWIHVQIIFRVEISRTKGPSTSMLLRSMHRIDARVERSTREHVEVIV